MKVPIPFHINSFNDYIKSYQISKENPEAFWSAIAENFLWKQKWDKVLNWNFSEPEINWFINGKLNITENCIDRHLKDNANKIAYIWEPNDPSGNSQEITYSELYKRVCSFANVLKKHGAKKGDRICIYMPMIPDIVIAVLACARIGAVHSVVFGGFSASAISDRILDADCSMVITADAMNRGAKQLPIKTVVDEALISCSGIKKVIVVDHLKTNPPMQSGRDFYLHQEISSVDEYCPAEIMDAEDMLLILYTSGSTGKPKGVVHTCGGYMVYTGYSFKNVFQYQENDIYWCTADIGWITGHSYMLYGPLLNGATSIIFEGVPNWPDASRCWKIIEKYNVNIFYTAPTAIRSLMACGNEFVKPYEMNSLKVLGSVGEPINEEAWHWFNEEVGKNRCPIVDTWWQTETGGIMISALAGISPLKPSFAGLPLPGIQPVLVDSDGKILEGKNVEGHLCIKFPWPSMIRTTYGDHERCRLNYFSTYKNMYFTGDGAKRDEEGMYRIIGRVDDVINVSGHRFGTAEIESAINESKYVVESAVVGYPHEIKGQGIYAYVICDNISDQEKEIASDIISTVEKLIGKIAKPDKIQIVSGLPKTRSGKIMRRILRKIAEGETSNLGDTTTLLDPAVVAAILSGAK
jgi:acetyl-CoA synthetase